MDRPPVGEVEDLTTLAKLDEQILLGELRERYRKGKIYTYVGDILIAVNPFKELGIYGNDVSKQYKMSKKSTKPPHIFAIADLAYQSLLGSGGRLPSNQCILISGESGAGKTESTKHIIKQLINLCHGSASNPNVNTQLEQQILQVNPLLEAFGNAQTNMNDNSSRFGKYIQLKFQKGHVMGAKISEYLLEKSRVVRQGSGEENFHIFYYLFASLPDSHDMFSLRDVDKYRYFCNGMNVLNQKKESLTKRYDELCNSMDLVGFTDEEQMNMFTMIASVLHLGNISFDLDDQDAAVVSHPNGAVKVASDATSTRTLVTMVMSRCSTNRELHHLGYAVWFEFALKLGFNEKLLQVDQEEVQACLTSMVTVTKGEYVKRNYNKHQAEDARDAMAKAIYGRLFGWIVNKINCLLAPENDIPSDELTEIGILDIFGFEHFEKNSFEQACINLANEQLQFFFNEHIFKMEQEEYMKEGIDWKEIKFVDNKPLLDMFLVRPMGLLALLDEESRFPKGTDQSYVEKVTAHFKGQKYFVPSPNTRQAVFSVNHYAGKVTYDCSQWLGKNRDTLPSGVMEILMSSSNPLVKTIFKAQITRTGSLALQGRTLRKSSRIRKMTPEAIRASAAKRKLTVGAQFKTSLNILMERMKSATPVFVRCLKPNHLKKADLFMDEFILAQLLYTGMLETTKIRREGFAVRPLFQEFVDNYKILLCEHSLRGSAENSAKILRASGMTGWHIGKTKVFLKYYHIEQLADIIERIGKSAIILQKAARGFVARRQAARLRLEAEKQRQLVAGLMQQLGQLSLVSFDNNERARAEDTKKPRDRNKGQNGHVEPPPVPTESPQGSNTNHLPPQSQTVSCGTGMDEDDEIIDDDFKAEASNKKKFGTPGRQATTVWFQETQTENVIDSNSNKFAEWFHGIISRRQSEMLLRGMPVGCYLIRVSESRFGYTLSFRAEDRSRHYMIDQLKNGKFIIIGETKVHRSLHDLIEHHKTHHISNWSGLLSDPCGQSGDCDYMDLLDEANRMYFVLDKEERSTRKSSTPTLPPRQYSVQPPPGPARMSGRPLPEPPQRYQRLISNQTDQHRYHQLEQTPDQPRSRLSATRKRLH